MNFLSHDKTSWGRSSLASMTLVYSFSHFAVDLSCIFLIVSLMMPQLGSRDEWLLCVMLYNMFAFAFQMPTGALADLTGRHALFSAGGCGLILAAYGINLMPSCLIIHILTAVVAGMGNSCFHIGGGIDMVHAGKGRAALPGIFVSTGAFGIYLGGRLYKTGYSLFTWVQLAVVALLIISALLMLLMFLKHGCRDWPQEPVNVRPGAENASLIMKFSGMMAISAACLVFTVCVRSYAGTVVSYEWQSSFLLGLLFVLGVILGKAGGGLIGDRLGWKLTGSLSLCLSAFLFIGGRNIPALGILAIFLFNMTMPLTLTALANMLPSHTGMAFGMTTFALFLGIIPSLFGDDGRMFAPLPMTIMVLASAAVFFIGIHIYERQFHLSVNEKDGPTEEDHI